MEDKYSQITLRLVSASLDRGEVARLCVTSNSMYPMIRKGDYVLIRTVDLNNLPFGAIVVFRRDVELITHRLIKVDSATVLTKGDNNSLPDPPINKALILGEVVQIERDNKKLSLERSRSRFVATFVGGANLISAKLNLTYDAIWTKLFKHRLEKVRFWVMHMLSFPMKMICRAALFFV